MGNARKKSIFLLGGVPLYILVQSEFCYFWDGTGTVKKLIPEKCLGTGTGKHWLRKKVQVPEKFGHGKK